MSVCLCVDVLINQCVYLPYESPALIRPNNNNPNDTILITPTQSSNEANPSHGDKRSRATWWTRLGGVMGGWVVLEGWWFELLRWLR